jgi:hypothetical protein
MSYGADPQNNPLDGIRRAIGDIGDDPKFSDDEILYYYTQHGTVFLAASYAASDLAALYASRVNKSIGSRSISNDQLFQHYSALSEKLAQQAKRSAMSSMTTPQIQKVRDTLTYPDRFVHGDEVPVEWPLSRTAINDNQSEDADG